MLTRDSNLVNLPTFVEKWNAFENRQIKVMDSHALEFWAEHTGPINVTLYVTLLYIDKNTS